MKSEVIPSDARSRFYAAYHAIRHLYWNVEACEDEDRMYSAADEINIGDLYGYSFLAAAKLCQEALLTRSTSKTRMYINVKAVAQERELWASRNARLGRFLVMQAGSSVDWSNDRL